MSTGVMCGLEISHIYMVIENLACNIGQSEGVTWTQIESVMLCLHI